MTNEEIKLTHLNIGDFVFIHGHYWGRNTSDVYRVRKYKMVGDEKLYGIVKAFNIRSFKPDNSKSVRWEKITDLELVTSDYVYKKIEELYSFLNILLMP